MKHKCALMIVALLLLACRGDVVSKRQYEAERSLQRIRHEVNMATLERVSLGIEEVAIILRAHQDNKEYGLGNQTYFGALMNSANLFFEVLATCPQDTVVVTMYQTFYIPVFDTTLECVQKALNLWPEGGYYE